MPIQRDPDALEREAVAAYLAGDDPRSDRAWIRAYREWFARGEARRSIRCAFWLAFRLLNVGDLARGQGWALRARRLVGGSDCVEQGYVGYLAGLQAIFSGDVESASSYFRTTVESADLYGDAELGTLGRVGLGRALIYQGAVREGVALLDEAMIAVVADELSPVVAGDSYCSVIEACRELFDIRRAHVWTEALSHWCDRQPGLVPYRGQCLIHRAEVLQLSGEWDAALLEADQARERLTNPAGQLAVGSAYYRLGELQRLRGEFGEAEASYRRANRFGCDPYPGLALLKLARGRIEVAVDAITVCLAEASGPIARSRALPAYVEIMLAAGDRAAARVGADELCTLGEERDAPLLRAVANQWNGAVLIAERAWELALVALRQALSEWREIDAPYDLARVQLLIGRCREAVGDREGADLALGAAKAAFTELGARADLARLAAPYAVDMPALTPREVEVLGFVARGWTNRAIANHLVLSERTVDRHVSSLLTKLNVASRTAAASYAHEHHLV